MSKHIDNKDERREARRKRRIRNQIIAYIVLIVLLVGVGFGGYKGGKIVIAKFKDMNVSAENVSNNEAQEGDDVGGVIASPEEPEDIIVQEEEPTVESSVDPEIQAYVESLPLEQKVAGMFIVTPEALTGVDRAVKAGEGTKTALSEHAIAGFIYDSKNVQTSEQFKEMIAGTKDMYKSIYNADMIIAFQEEGAINTVAGTLADVSKIDAAGEIGKTGDSGNAYQAYITVGKYMSDFGANMNYGPVADVLVDANSFIGNRSFSDDADIASSMVSQAVNAQKEMGIITCMTGFPGRGAATSDPANGAVSIDRSLDDLRNCEFKPYKAGIEQGADAIVVSNVVVPSISGEIPCSLAPEVLTDIIRGELGFEGIVMVGNMDDKAITSTYSSGDAAVMAICAGADIIVKPANFNEAYDAVMKAVNEGVISEDRINQSLIKICTAKK